jgi:hypothetical protein
MAFQSPKWHPIALALSALNLIGAGFAVAMEEPFHAVIHVSLAVGFGLWARRLRPQGGAADTAEVVERLEALEGEVGRLRQELSEAQERLDFTERVLAQGRDPARVSKESR